MKDKHKQRLEIQNSIIKQRDKIFQTLIHQITTGKVLKQSIHNLLKGFAVRGTAVRKMATALQRGRSVCLTKPKCHMTATSLSNETWRGSTF
jgi:hypothetical protein